MFLTSKFLMKNVQPLKFRSLALGLKYVLFPIGCVKMSSLVCGRELEDKFRTVASKYNFGYRQYNEVMDLLERANRVGKLEELMTKRSKFCWEGIPEFKSKYTTDE